MAGAICAPLDFLPGRTRDNIIEAIPPNTMTRQQISIVAILVGLNLLVVCGGGMWILGMLGPSAAQPQAASYNRNTTTLAALPPTPQPSSTRIEPTATLVLAPDPIVATILGALQKTDAAYSFRIQLDASVSGSLASAISNQNTVVILSATGESGGTDSHIVMKGLAMSKLTSDSARAVELSTVAGKNYVKGPLPLLGAKENKWYVLPPSQTLFRESPVGLYSLFDQSLGKSSMARGAGEKLDSRPCDVYTGDKNAAIAAFADLGGQSQLKGSDYARFANSITSAEYKFWVCDDGYVHQIRIGFDGADPGKPSQRFNFRLTVHAFDFGGKISIAAPSNAIAATPMIDLNELFAPTPTPFRVPTMGFPGLTPYQIPTFELPALTPFAPFAFPTISNPFVQPSPTP
jgi:hypothetical protein